MKQKIYIFFLICGWLFSSQVNYAQVDFNKRPNDDLGNVEDEFQESFYEALKQKGIGNYDRSVDALLKCIELNNSIPVLYFELGKNYNKLKNFGAAEDAFKKAVNKDADNEWFLDELYGFYASQNDYDNAIKTLKKLVDHHLDYKEDLVSLYVKIQKYDEALKILDQLDLENGISIERDAIRNRIYENTGRKKDQILNLEQRVDKNPDKDSNYLALIFRYSENNEKEKAFETAKKLLEINPNSQEVHLALYKFYLDDNNTSSAIESMKTVIKSPKIKSEAKLKVLADFVKFVKKNPQYEEDLVDATNLINNADNSGALEELGHYYLLKKNNAKALEYLEAALKTDPNNFNLLCKVLLLYVDLQKYNLAEEKSSVTLNKFPSQPILYLINGKSLNQLNKPKKAIESLNIGVDYVIDDAKMEMNFYNQLSKSYTLLGNTEKAKSFSDKAKKIEILK